MSKTIEVDGETVFVSDPSEGESFYFFQHKINGKEYFIRYNERFNTFGIADFKRFAEQCIKTIDGPCINFDTPPKDISEYLTLSANYKDVDFLCFRAIHFGKDLICFETKEKMKEILGNGYNRSTRIPDGQNRLTVKRKK